MSTNNNRNQQGSDSQSQFSTQTNSGGPRDWNSQNQVVNDQDQNRSINTGDEEFKENVTGRTPEEPPKDLNISGSAEKEDTDTAGGAEVETPHKIESDDETSTERKIPKM